MKPLVKQLGQIAVPLLLDNEKNLKTFKKDPNLGEILDILVSSAASVKNGCPPTAIALRLDFGGFEVVSPVREAKPCVMGVTPPV